MATTVVLDASALDELRSVMRGPVITPDDSDYDVARTLHNAMIDKRPVLIARCTGVADVQAALDFGLRHNLEIAVKGGGHNVGGKALCDGGIVIDLSGMKGIRVDPASRTVRAEAGVTWGEFDRETQVFGLATTGGAVSTTGIAGLTLGGGIGWLQRKHGLTCDNLISADVVTPDGRFVKASETENGDLFWGLRGGGGNFGIVTSFEYRLHPLGPQVVGGPLMYPLDAARDLYEFHREFSASAPDELFCEFGLGPLPDGQPGSFMFLMYAGPPDEGERVVEPARKFKKPVEDFLGPAAYCDVQQMFDEDLPPGLHNYWKSNDLAELSDGAIETILDFYAERPPGAFVVIDQFGGAVARVPDDATAFGHRHAAYDLIIATLWPDPEQTEEHVEWARGLWDAIQPYAEESVYVNYLGEEGEERVHAAYGEEKYARLAALKRKYDPENVLRNNQNIKPEAAVSG
jgi:FAD/FMN-containing dehydrogenase